LPYKTVVVAYNSNREAVTVHLPSHSHWNTLCNGMTAGCLPVESFSGEQGEMESLSTAVWAQ
jgi:hypothetical protein